MDKKIKKQKIGIILGGNLEDLNFFKKAKKKNVLTPYGKAEFFLFKNLVFLFRHKDNKIPSHKINYLSNIYGFKKLGVKFIFAFNSTGSLKKEIKPGTFLIPSDYIDFDPPTFFDKECQFITPELSQKGREIFKKILKKLKIDFKDGGVYFLTKGPRLETKAEINLIKNFADVVGMTMTKEATLAKESGIEYASLCSIDNFAHGIGKEKLDQKEIEKNQKRNKKIIEEIIQEIAKL